MGEVRKAGTQWITREGRGGRGSQREWQHGSRHMTCPPFPHLPGIEPAIHVVGIGLVNEVRREDHLPASALLVIRHGVAGGSKRAVDLSAGVQAGGAVAWHQALGVVGGPVVVSL